ncbi:hypothetical protein BH24CHL5_BH24CHL5_04090 [soil metagenome]
MISVLVTYAGGAYGLGVTRSLKAASRPYRVIATDADRFSIQRAEGDEAHRLPRASDERFVPALAGLVRSARADFVWPGHDSDVRVLARERDRLGAASFLPPTSDIELCRDKLLSYTRWKACGVPVPETVLVTDHGQLAEAFDQFGGEVWLRAVIGAGGRGALATDSPRKAEAWLDVHDGWGRFTAARRIKGGHRLSWESVWAHGELIAVQGRRQLVQGFEHLTLSRITGVPGVNQWGTPP